jgi:hypothetical protein
MFTPAPGQGFSPVKAEPKTPALANLPEIHLSAEKLPSKGLSYPAGCEISYRPYSFGEVKKVSQSKMTAKAAYQEVLSGISCSFGPENLTMSDFLFIGLLRKISTLGSSKATVIYRCAGCFKENSAFLNSSQMEFEDVAIPSVPAKVSLQAGEFLFGFPTVGALIHLESLGKSEDPVHILASACVSHSIEEMVPIIDSCMGEDSATLEQLDSLLFHGLKPSTFKCSHCEHKNSIELDGGQALIMPFRGDAEPSKSRISFGP